MLDHVCASDGKRFFPTPVTSNAQFRDRDKGASLTMEERDQGKARLAVFCQWFHESVMRQDPDSLSDAILVLPEGQAVPEYRDEAV